MNTEQRLQISGAVFVYACLTLVLVALVTAGASVFFALKAGASEVQTSEKLLSANQRLLQCNNDIARLDGRVQTFEGLLLRPHHTALEASVRLFLHEQGKRSQELNLQEYETWLIKRK